MSGAGTGVAVGSEGDEGLGELAAASGEGEGLESATDGEVAATGVGAGSCTGGDAGLDEPVSGAGTASDVEEAGFRVAALLGDLLGALSGFLVGGLVGPLVGAELALARRTGRAPHRLQIQAGLAR